MKKHLMTGLLALMALGVYAQGNEWKDPRVNEVNRLPMHSHYFAFENEKAAQNTPEQAANYMTLHGNWKFNWVEDADARPTDFWKTDYNDRAWGTMPVPGMWELNGYGDPLYVNIGYAWKNQFDNNPPEIPVKNNHVGSYRKEITVPASWNGKQIIAHFGSVTSNIYLWVNGRFVGYSEDSKLEAEFDLTPFVKPGQKNLIAFQVFRWCDGTYLEDQDFFRYCGVARDSYLYARSKQQITDIRVTPDLDAQYRDGQLDVQLTTKGGGTVDLSLVDAAGKEVISQSLKATPQMKLTLNVSNPNKWTAETPYLYTLKAILKNGANVVEVIPVKVGFRKIEIKDAQVLVNGQPVLFKGADRHELDPDGGYVMSKERMVQDIQIMKKFNINGVRTCHYPDDSYWYDLCDQYGIYVVAEANLESHGMGYGKETLAIRDDYKLAHMQRNQRNVQRNFNHPSIIFWSLGNEAGYGANFEAAYDWVKAEDKSRPVQYERAGYDGKTDIYCPMYLDYKNAIKYSEDPAMTKPLIQCEYAHAMGNSEGGFKEYWDIIRKYPKYQGGFIWDFVDQSIRWEKNGKMIYGYGGDFNKFDASDQNFCDNGLISPDRVPNPHMYEVGYYYQNIWTKPVDMEKGIISVYNENFFRDLSDYYMEWTLLHNGKVEKTGRVDNLNVAPQQTANIQLDYGETCKHCEWLLNVSYKLKQRDGLLPVGFEVAKDQLVINPFQGTNVELKNRVTNNQETLKPVIDNKDKNYIIVSGEQFRMEFSRQTGYLVKYQLAGQEVLQDGASLTPNFWRAPTDNDYGAGLQRRFATWKKPQMRIKEFEVDDNSIEVEIDMPDQKAKLEMTYTLTPEGEIIVREHMEVDKDAKVSELFRFGMSIQMPKQYNQVEYYGRGPIETYCDRKDSEFLGVYKNKVNDEYFEYIRPQESGNHVDVRWFSVIDNSGKGLQFYSNAPIEASALPYTNDMIDDGMHKDKAWGRHSGDLIPSGMTTVHVQQKQLGLGCVNSWGAWPRNEYRLPYKDYDFTFAIKPLK